MEVQVRYMMIRKNMKFYSTNIVLLFLFFFNTARSLEYTGNLYGAKDDNYNLAIEKARNILKESNSPEYKIIEANFVLGHFFAHGHGLVTNIDSAIYYLEKASQLELLYPNKYYNYDSTRLLSQIYYDSKYKREDKSQSFKLLTLAAELGDIRSNLELGEIYLKGYATVLKDSIVYDTITTTHNGKIQKGISYRHCIAPTTRTIKYPFLAIDSIKGYNYYINGYDPNRKLIGHQYVLTKLDFAKAYIKGNYLNFDYVAAFRLLSEYKDLPIKHDKELAEALWILQALYRFGRGTRINPLKANEILNRAAECGHTLAKHAISFIQGK